MDIKTPCSNRRSGIAGTGIFPLLLELFFSSACAAFRRSQPPRQPWTASGSESSSSSEVEEPGEEGRREVSMGGTEVWIAWPVRRLELEEGKWEGLRELWEEGQRWGRRLAEAERLTSCWWIQFLWNALWEHCRRRERGWTGGRGRRSRNRSSPSSHSPPSLLSWNKAKRVRGRSSSSCVPSADPSRPRPRQR